MSKRSTKTQKGQQRKAVQEPVAAELPKAEDIPQPSEVNGGGSKLASTQASEDCKITFEGYLRRVSVRPGLVASFKAEAANTPGALDPKTAEEWAAAFEKQAKRVYP